MFIVTIITIVFVSRFRLTSTMDHTFYCRIHTSILHYTVVSCDCHPNWSTIDFA